MKTSTRIVLISCLVIGLLGGITAVAVLGVKYQNRQRVIYTETFHLDITAYLLGSQETQKQKVSRKSLVDTSKNFRYSTITSENPSHVTTTESYALHSGQVYTRSLDSVPWSQNTSSLENIGIFSLLPADELLQILGYENNNFFEPFKKITYNKNLLFLNQMTKSQSNSNSGLTDVADALTITVETDWYKVTKITISIKRTPSINGASIEGEIQYDIGDGSASEEDTVVKQLVGEARVGASVLTENEMKEQLYFGTRSADIQLELYFSPYCPDGDKACNAFRENVLPYIISGAQSRFWYGVQVTIVHPYGSSLEAANQNFGVFCAAEQHKAKEYLDLYGTWISDATFYKNRTIQTLTPVEENALTSMGINTKLWRECINAQTYLQILTKIIPTPIIKEGSIELIANDLNRTALTGFPSAGQVDQFFEDIKTYFDNKNHHDPKTTYKQ